jgi:hypothetical protein
MSSQTRANSKADIAISSKGTFEELRDITTQCNVSYEAVMLCPA